MDETETFKKLDHDQNDNGLSYYTSILDDICQEAGVQLTWLPNNWVAILERNGTQKFMVGLNFNINSLTTSQIANDKNATYEVLQRYGIPAVECRLLYEETNPEPYARGYQSMGYVEDYFNKHQQHIVLKPNFGQGGADVYQITKMGQVRPALKKVFHQGHLAAMCPFYDIRHEYRFIMLDGEVRLAYAKERGDNWQFNLSHGAKAGKIEDAALYEKLLALAKRVVQALGIRFCSVDMIETQDGEIMVMEVNSSVSTSKYLEQHPEDYAKVKQIYADVLEKVFAEN